MILCELVNISKQVKRISISDFAELLYSQYSELRNRYECKSDFYAELVSFLDHGFMVARPSDSKKKN